MKLLHYIVLRHGGSQCPNRSADLGNNAQTVLLTKGPMAMPIFKYWGNKIKTVSLTVETKSKPWTEGTKSKPFCLLTKQKAN